MNVRKMQKMKEKISSSPFVVPILGSAERERGVSNHRDVKSISSHTKQTLFSTQFSSQKTLTVTIKKNDHLSFIDADSMLSSMTFILEANAMLSLFSWMKKGTKNISVILKGKNAQANVHGIYLLDGKEALQINTQQDHQVAQCKSSVILRGVLAQKATVSHHGKIFVNQDASNTDAKQNNKTMLLSPDSQLHSCPELAVFNSKSICIHGSAAGRFDAQQLFYLRSRGLSEKDAKHLLLKAFFALPFNALSDKKEKTELLQAINKKIQEML